MHSIIRQGAAAGEYFLIAERAEFARLRGQQVVVVQGLGFVGAAVAAVAADAAEFEREPRYFVIGLDLPTGAGRAKVAAINGGRTPVVSPDEALNEMTRKAVDRGNLCATTDPRALSLADVIMVDVQLDVALDGDGVTSRTEADLEPFADAIRTIGRFMRAEALVLVETTVPIGACDRIVKPILDEEREARGMDAPLLLAHAYERVMPGPRYVDSIRRFWRSLAGIDERSTARAQEFLSTIVRTEEFPLCRLAEPAAGELAKLLENSYRAVNIAFIQEWTLLAERVGVNLFEIVESIRLRRGTHDNIRQPGFGVGGYCLTKDGALAQWAARELFGLDVNLEMTMRALGINRRMPLHTLELLEEAAAPLAGKRIALCGVSYLPEVGDTRHSPAEIFVRELNKTGAMTVAHDSYVKEWREMPDVPLFSDLRAALQDADAVVFAVRHPEYAGMTPAEWLGMTGKPAAFVDAQNIISDASAAALHLAGCRVIGVGKGHWRKRGYHIIK